MKTPVQIGSLSILQDLQEKNCHLHFDQAANVAEIKIESCTQAQFDALQQLLIELMQAAPEANPLDKQANRHNQSTDKDYRQYFDAIMQSALYKPGNPQLAIIQVAKKYHLSVSDLKYAFIHR